MPAASSPPPAQVAAEPPPFRTVEEAERALRDADRELSEAAARPEDTAKSPPTGIAESRNERKTAEQERREVHPSSPCETSCRALASMKRAADAICRMAGEGDARCGDARKKVEASTARVAACGCS
jgi:hypothetical protein